MLLFRIILDRCSLYFVQNENELVYVMHENSVIRVLGYVMRYFADNRKRIPPLGFGS